MTAAAIKFMETKHPVSGKRIGTRIVVATINEARYDMLTEEYCQSYAPCYRITESGDYTKLTKEIVEKFIEAATYWHKITEFVQR